MPWRGSLDAPMDVIAVCRSKKTKRTAAARVLDQYLFRIGDRTWRGRASMACLKRISEELRATASRNTAVAIYRSGSTEQQQKPLFVIGSRSRFDPSGRCPVSTRSRKTRGTIIPAEVALQAIVEIVALFHDVGKASRLFNEKIRRSIATGKALADPVRHEVISALVVADILPMDCVTATEIAARLTRVAAEPSIIDEAWARVSDRVKKLHCQGAQGADILSTRVGLGDPTSLRAQLILLILSHHRLPDANHAPHGDPGATNSVRCGIHFQFELPLSRSCLDIADGIPFWHEAWFASRLTSTSERLAAAKMIPLKGLDVIVRTALMAADHTGSFKKEVGTGEGHLANSLELPNGTVVPADSLSQHTRRVTEASRSMMVGHLKYGGSGPGIAEDMIPPAIRAPRITGSRFDWQANAAHAAADLVSSGDGGFFGVLMAGTGSGKTRGAATVMTGASLTDAGPRGTELRYNLALPLRSLATQSGREYVEDLGFSPRDVSVMVGGRLPEWIDERVAEEAEKNETSGSEDRGGLWGDLVSMTVEDIDAAALVHAGALGADFDRKLPAYLDMFCEADRSGKARAFLTTPILSATIDHFMPSASPLRGGHLTATWRVMSADLVIDELDQMSEEDLSAVRRLVRIAGLGGRRVLIMSATLTAAIVQSFYEVYVEAWRTQAEMKGRPDTVHHLVAGDAPGAIASSINGEALVDSLAACAASVASDLDQREPVQLAEILPRAETWAGQVDIIRDHTGVLHERHCVLIDGRRISVGLVRITRVKHLQRLAVDLARQNDGCLYVVLHSAMPRVIRDRIERDLKSILTRKGDDPNRALAAFIQTHAPKEWMAGGDIRIIVLSSPVIETGNDVDFDWAITDAPGVRSIVQTAGRVNRHRRIMVRQPNVAILGDYLVSREARPATSGKNGMAMGLMVRPGVETLPHKECGVDQIVLPADKAMTSLLNRSAPFVVDARLCDPRSSTLAAAENALQCRFANVFDQDSPSPLFWMSRKVTRHRFRRQDVLMIDVFPVCDDVTTWKTFIGRHREPSWSGVVPLEKTHFTGSLLRVIDLESLLLDVKGSRSGKLAMMSPLSIRIGTVESIGETQYLDPVLGALGKQDHPPELSFATLHDPSNFAGEKIARK